MNIGILGTGMVGETLATKLISLNHKVKMGSRSASNEKAAAWVKKNGANASQGTFADAAKFGEIVINCTKGEVALEALKSAGEENLKGKVLIDVSNPLDFSKGMPPTLTVCNTDSVGEQIQKNFPSAKVVKSFNTMNCLVMVNPRQLSGSHIIFLCGNDAGAKNKVRDLLKSFAWKDEEILDLGDISASRGTEMVLPLWLRIMGTLNSGSFNFNIVK
jgi:8-hydroxy-5-deazaflavin:NADPH oxidoreductase